MVDEQRRCTRSVGVPQLYSVAFGQTGVDRTRRTPRLKWTDTSPARTRGSATGNAVWIVRACHFFYLSYGDDQVERFEIIGLSDFILIAGQSGTGKFNHPSDPEGQHRALLSRLPRVMVL